MTRNERAAESQRNYTIGTGNIITGGTITNSPITSLRSADGQQAWREQLGAELARIRVLLEADHDLVISEDRHDAIEAVRELETNLASAEDGAQADPKTFRLRVKALIGVLAPVAEIIGGVAALQAILQHL